ERLGPNWAFQCGLTAEGPYVNNRKQSFFCFVSLLRNIRVTLGHYFIVCVTVCVCVCEWTVWLFLSAVVMQSYQKHICQAQIPLCAEERKQKNKRTSSFLRQCECVYGVRVCVCVCVELCVWCVFNERGTCGSLFLFKHSVCVCVCVSKMEREREIDVCA